MKLWQMQFIDGRDTMVVYFKEYKNVISVLKKEIHPNTKVAVTSMVSRDNDVVVEMKDLEENLKFQLSEPPYKVMLGASCVGIHLCIYPPDLRTLKGVVIMISRIKTED